MLTGQPLLSCSAGLSTAHTLCEARLHSSLAVETLDPSASPPGHNVLTSDNIPPILIANRRRRGF